MTDKQEVIIDGVDVSGCEKYPLSNKWHGSIIFCKGGCKAYPNCEYKQLQRKTAECEELKNTLNKLTRGVVIPMQEPEVINLANHYHKALDEIEEYTIKNFCQNCEADDYTASCPMCEYQEYFDIIRKAKGDIIENT